MQDFTYAHLYSVKSKITGYGPSKEGGLSMVLHGAFLNLKQSEFYTAWSVTLSAPSEWLFII